MKVSAYDVMDQVQVVVRVVCQEDWEEGVPEWETLVVTRIPGTGTADRREWVQDALIAALEAL